MRDLDEPAKLKDVVAAMFLTVILVCAFNIFLGALQKHNFGTVIEQLNRIEKTKIEIIENQWAIEQDSFYSNE